MGAGKQRWWDINGDRVRRNLALYEQRVAATRAGFVPLTVRVHGFRFVVAAGIEVREVPAAPSVNAAGNEDSTPANERVTMGRWVPAWCEALAESTMGWGNSAWRGTMLREANDDPEVRSALLAALRIGGAEALAARYGGGPARAWTDSDCVDSFDAEITDLKGSKTHDGASSQPCGHHLSLYGVR